jgi:hypothetical protein
MSNGSENIDDMGFEDRLALIKAMNGISDGQQQEPAADDETYAIFTDGDYAGREFKRIAKPSYGQRKNVEKIRIKTASVSPSVKDAICDELGWDKDDVTEELPMIEYHKQILPLITREDLPEGWNIEDVSSYEVTRMLHDFLLGT